MTDKKKPILSVPTSDDSWGPDSPAPSTAPSTAPAQSDDESWAPQESIKEKPYVGSSGMLGGFFDELGQGNTLGLVKGILTHPIDTAGGIVKGIAHEPGRVASEISQAYNATDPEQRGIHINRAIPFFGPQSEKALTQFGNEQYGRAAANMLDIAGQTYMPEIAGDVAKAAGKYGPAIPSAMRESWRYGTEPVPYSSKFVLEPVNIPRSLAEASRGSHMLKFPFSVPGAIIGGAHPFLKGFRTGLGDYLADQASSAEMAPFRDVAAERAASIKAAQAGRGPELPVGSPTPFQTSPAIESITGRKPGGPQNVPPPAPPPAPRSPGWGGLSPEDVKLQPPPAFESIKPSLTGRRLPPGTFPPEAPEMNAQLRQAAENVFGKRPIEPLKPEWGSLGSPEMLKAAILRMLARQVRQ